MRSTAPVEWVEKSDREFIVPRAAGAELDAEIRISDGRLFGKGDTFAVVGYLLGLQTVFQELRPPPTGAELTRKAIKIRVQHWDVTVEEATGAYVKKPVSCPTYTVIVVKGMFPMDDDKVMAGDIIFRGPKKTVDAHRKAFEEWLKNFKR